MRGLLLKDWLVISKQAKVYFVLMAVFALMPGMGIYSIFFGALLPMTAFAYDERSRWDTMARMMPYSFLEMVAGKYLFGYLMVGGIVLLEMMVQILYCLTGINSLSVGESMQGIWIPAVAALNVMALQMPVIFWLGVEKTRIFLMFVTIGTMMVLQTAFFPMVLEFNAPVPELGLPVELAVLGVTVLLQLLSLWVSEKLYRCNPERKR